MSSPVSFEPPHYDPALAAGRVVQSAMDLARAEAQLVLAHARTTLVRTVGAVLAGIVATSAAQVALVLCALSPVFFASWSRTAVLVAILPSVGISALGTVLAILGLRSLRSAPLVSAPAATR